MLCTVNHWVTVTGPNFSQVLSTSSRVWERPTEVSEEGFEIRVRNPGLDGGNSG